MQTEPPTAPRSTGGGDDGALLAAETGRVTPPANGTPLDAATPGAGDTTRVLALRCPSCGAPNGGTRELCRACGVDLQSGEELRQPAATPDPFTTTPVLPRRRRARWWLPLVAILAVAAAVLVGLSVAGIGPLAPAPELPSASFRPERYPEATAANLPLAYLATLTARPSEGGRGFDRDQLADDDLTTAWHADPGARPEGRLETVELLLEQPGWVSHLVVANGDQHDQGSFASAARVERIRLRFDGGRIRTAVLLDLPGRQEVALDEPVLTTTVRLEVLAEFPGEEGQGVALSDVDLRGWPADDQDTALADRRAELQPAVPPEPTGIGQSS
jgi:hypothetical protein